MYMLCTIVPYITNLITKHLQLYIDIIIFNKRVVYFLSCRLVFSDYSLHSISIFHLSVTWTSLTIKVQHSTVAFPTFNCP